MTHSISVTDTAKIIREQLKSAFPSFKFSVKSKSYSGGASIDIKWVDGPTTKAVESIVKHYEGATFDGMIDLKSYSTHEYKGEKVYFGADFIFCHREYSRQSWEKAISATVTKYGVLPPCLKESRYHDHRGDHVSYYLDGAQSTFRPWQGSPEEVRDLVNKELWAMNLYGDPRTEAVEPAPQLVGAQC